MSLENYFRAFSYATIAVATLALVLAGGLNLALAILFFALLIAAWKLEGGKWSVVAQKVFDPQAVQNEFPAPLDFPVPPNPPQFNLVLRQLCHNLSNDSRGFRQYTDKQPQKVLQSVASVARHRPDTSKSVALCRKCRMHPIQI